MYTEVLPQIVSFLKFYSDVKYIRWLILLTIQPPSNGKVFFSISKKDTNHAH